MSEGKCSCERLLRLEGASVHAYICAYLEQPGSATSEEKTLYRCRVCGRAWEKRWPESKREGTRPALIRQS
jgi:hypothetical protein